MQPMMYDIVLGSLVIEIHDYSANLNLKAEFVTPLVHRHLYNDGFFCRADFSPL